MGISDFFGQIRLKLLNIGQFIKYWMDLIFIKSK